ncbi:CD109 antigen-like, partial [Ruditapes philippinarum]|uniref:CD109 antigen-like n=1 Tax=Ruditapes philippinarum TaxID=129788 RepID=UPI00295B0C22
MSQYKVLVNGSGGVSFSAESRINYVDDNLHIFIQTDKTIYSATQEVKYRAILLHRNLFGYKGLATVIIRDGKNNKIEVRENLIPKDGVITGRLQLSREPVFGTWSIDINAATKKLTKHFEVNDYAIPRFSVDIALPKEIPYQSASVNVSVKAKFTFGAKVYGNCKLQIYTKASIYNFLEYNKHMQGSVTFTVPISDISRQFSLYDTFIVRALVTDNATTLTIGTEENLWINYVYPTQRPQTINRYLSISKLEKRDTFIPGMSYYTQIFVGYNDGPIGKPGVINVTPTVTTAEVKSCLLNKPSTKWLDLKTTTLQSFDIPFDNEGYADLSFPVAEYTDKIVLQLRYETIYKNVTLYSVSSVPVLLLRMYTNKTNVQVGQRLEIMTEASGDLDGLISYEIFARGVLRKTLISGVANEKRTKTGFEITADMIPEVYVVATHVTKAGDLLTDHLLLRVYGSPLKNK